MNKEKQIEEMTKTLCGRIYSEECNDFCLNFYNCSVEEDCQNLFAAGYRKQAWVSVEEALPERNGRYLTHCNIEGQSLVCVLYYCKFGGFWEGTVTHWMPLPYPPKGENHE